MAARIWLYAVMMTALTLPGIGLAGDVPRSAGEIRPLLIGATVPDASLRTFDDEETTLYAALGNSRAVLIFYRGGW